MSGSVHLEVYTQWRRRATAGKHGGIALQKDECFVYQGESCQPPRTEWGVGVHGQSGSRHHTAPESRQGGVLQGANPTSHGLGGRGAQGHAHGAAAFRGRAEGRFAHAREPAEHLQARSREKAPPRALRLPERRGEEAPGRAGAHHPGHPSRQEEGEHGGPAPAQAQHRPGHQPRAQRPGRRQGRGGAQVFPPGHQSARGRGRHVPHHRLGPAGGGGLQGVLRVRAPGALWPTPATAGAARCWWRPPRRRATPTGG